MKNGFFPFVVFFLFNGMVTAGLSAAESHAPSEKPFHIGAGLGYSFTGYKDEVESPINRYLNTPTYIIDGNIEKKNFLHSFNISFFMGNAKMAAPYKKYRQKEFISARGNIDYSLDYRLWGNQTFPGYLGGAFRTVVYFSGFSGTSGTDNILSPPTGAALFSLDLHVSQKWNINDKYTVIFSAGYPIFGYAIRPAYAGFDELWMEYLYESPLKIITLGKITSFHNYWAVYGDLMCWNKISSLLSSYAGFGFDLSHIDFPLPRKDAISRLKIGLLFVF
jgi:hypothetical protein